jgi:ATP-dependent RNA helicase DeaD
MGGQIAELKSGVQVVAGTPGRLLDHLRRKTLSLSGLRILILDEADEMLSMGFAKDLDAILEFLPKERQSLLFSATIPEDIRALAQRFLHNPEMVSLSKKVGAKEVTHYCYMVSGMGKQRDLVRILKSVEPEDAIIFCNTREDTHFIASYLRRQGFDAEEISGDLPQSEREIVMGKIKRKELRFLVATDVAARGIDISELSHVINYSIPEYHEVYIHRTGRTGRAGRSGTAISLVAPQELGNFVMIRKIYKLETTERELPIDDDVLVESTSRRKPTPSSLVEAPPEQTKQLPTPTAPKVVTKPAEPTPEVKIEPKVEPKPEVKIEAKPEPRHEPKPKQEAKPEPKPRPETRAEEKTVKPEPRPEPKTQERREAKPEARVEAKPEPKTTPSLPTLSNETWGEALDILLSPKEIHGRADNRLPEPPRLPESKHQKREAEASRPEPKRHEPRHETKKPSQANFELSTESKNTALDDSLPTIEIKALPVEEFAELPEQEEIAQPISGDIAVAFAEALRETLQAQEKAQTNEEGDEESDEEGEEGDSQDSVKMTRIYLNLGRRDHVRASEVTRFLREHVKLTRRDLGRVQVRDTFSHVGIRLDLAEQLLTSLQGQKFRNKEVVVELAKHNRNRSHTHQEEKSAEASLIASPEFTHMGINIELEAAIQEPTLRESAAEAVEANPPEAQPTKEAPVAPQEETPQ